jgi:hypothetical protein
MSGLDSTTTTQTSLPSGSSPGVKPDNIFSAQTKFEALSPEMQSLANLISGMRHIVKTINGTCGFLEKATKYAATAAPAIKATDELEALRLKLQEQKASHEAELQALEVQLASHLQEAVKGSLRQEAVSKVRKRVREELGNSVKEELRRQLPPELQQETQKHPEQMREARVNVYNSEARARNSSVHVGSDPLRKIRLSNDQAHALFPSTVRMCADLSNKDVDELLKVYQVIAPPAQPQPKDVAPLTREEKINIFMAFIGVPLRVALAPSPSKDGKNDKKVTSTLVFSNI